MIPENIKQLANKVRNEIYGRDVRESIAQSMEVSGETSNEANERSKDTDARQTDVENRFDDQIAGNTDIDEVIDARRPEGGQSYPTLRKRLDDEHKEVTAQLAQTTLLITEPLRKIPVGNIKLPGTFPEIPFTISKIKDWSFSHGLTPQVINDWSNATEVFIGTEANTGVDGTDKETPINIEIFISRYKQGLYSQQKNFILSFVDEVYSPSAHSTNNLFSDIDVNVYFRSVYKTGRTIIGSVRNSHGGDFVWENHNGNVYKAIQPTGVSVDYPFNINSRDGFGMFPPSNEKKTLIDCQNEEGSFYRDLSNNTIYYHKHKLEDISDVEIARRLNVARLNQGNGKFYFEGLDFLADSYSLSGNSLSSEIYISDCTFYRGDTNAFTINGIYKVFIVDSVASYGSADGFNYHTEDTNTLAVEVNCVSYGNGEYKFIGGHSATSSNNGSTAHNGMHILRVGCRYSRCEGSVIADIQNCYSINIGCEVFDILPTASSTRAGFYVQNEEGVTPETEKPKYFIECRQSGYYFRRMIYAPNTTKTYYENVIGEIDKSYGLPAISENANKIRWELVESNQTVN